MIAVLAALLASAQPVPASPYDQGVAARRAGKSSLAVEQLKLAVAAEPNNADAWVQYGFALRDVGRPAEARTAFETALRLAPAYQDARDGLAFLDRPTDRAARTVIDVDGSLTSVRHAQNWRELRIGGTTALNVKTKIGAAVEASRRFGLSDVYGEAQIDVRPSAASSVYGLVGGTPHADYRPRWQVGGGGTYRIANGRAPTLVTFDGTLARYADGRTWTLSPGLQQYAADGRVWLTGKWINVFAGGRHRSGVLGQLDVQASDGVRLFAGAARAPDLSEGRVLTTTSLFGGAVVRMSNSIDWRLSAARDRPSNGLNRTTLSTGLSLRLP